MTESSDMILGANPMSMFIKLDHSVLSGLLCSVKVLIHIADELFSALSFILI